MKDYEEAKFNPAARAPTRLMALHQKPTDELLNMQVCSVATAPLCCPKGLI